MRNPVTPPGLTALGPYSLAVDADPFVYLSGQTPIDASGGLIAGDIDAQTRQCFANLAAVLAAAGLGLAQVQKVNVYLTWPTSPR
jgi:2-iminobutanoate/2-iminopropanoate deaminase